MERDNRDRRVLNWIIQEQNVAMGLVSATSLSTDLNCSVSAMAWSLKRLVANGALEKHPDCPRLYRLIPSYTTMLDESSASDHSE